MQTRSREHLGSGHQLRGGGLQNWRAGASEVLPLRKGEGGGANRFTHPEGGGGGQQVMG